MADDRFVSKYCEGVTCHICKKAPAEHKVEEVIFDDDPIVARHPLTAYVCRTCFITIMGPYGVAVLESARLNLTGEEAKIVFDLIDNPPEPNEALKLAMERRQEVISSLGMSVGEQAAYWKALFTSVEHANRRLQERIKHLEGGSKP